MMIVSIIVESDSDSRSFSNSSDSIVTVKKVINIVCSMLFLCTYACMHYLYYYFTLPSFTIGISIHEFSSVVTLINIYNYTHVLIR